MKFTVTRAILLMSCFTMAAAPEGNQRVMGSGALPEIGPEEISRTVFRIANISNNSSMVEPEVFGTGFLISKEHRLLATAGHVADLYASEGRFCAIQNEKGTIYDIDGVWYHPDIRRDFDEHFSLQSDDPSDGSVSLGSPDVAILHLADGGGELADESPLAVKSELEGLEGDQVQSFGFGRAIESSKHAHQNWQTRRCQMATATFIGRAGFTGDATVIRRQQTEGPWLLTTHLIGPGGSGGPIFLKNGNIAGIYIGSILESTGEYLDLSISIESIRRTLDAHGLPSEMRNSRAQLSAGQTAQQERGRQAVELVRGAEKLISQQRYQDAGWNCNEAIRLIPDYQKARLRRSQNFLRYCQAEWSRLSKSDRKLLAEYALTDVDNYLKILGYDYDESALTLAYSYVYLCLAKSDFLYLEDVVKGLTEALEKAPQKVSGRWRAEMLNLRAFCWETLRKYDRSRQDHEEAMRLDPTEQRWSTEYKAFLERLGWHAGS